MSNRIHTPYEISVGITWVDGRVFMKHTSKYSKFWYGVCHLSHKIWMFCPNDYPEGSMITTILADLIIGKCDREKMCVNYKCQLNKFNRDYFISEFKGMGGMTLGLPYKMGEKAEWFNVSEKYTKIWDKAIELFTPHGGHWRFDLTNKDVGD